MPIGAKQLSSCGLYLHHLLLAYACLGDMLTYWQAASNGQGFELDAVNFRFFSNHIPTLAVILIWQVAAKAQFYFSLSARWLI